MKSFLKRFDEAIFGYGSPLTLGVFRAIFAGLIAVNLVMIATDFDSWFTERGLVPVKASMMWAGGEHRLNLLAWVTDVHTTATVYAITMLAAVLTALGLGTRVASIILAVGLVTLHHRNPFILHSGDTLMRVCAIYLAVAPCGAAFSLDRKIRQHLGRPVVDRVSLWPQRLIQFQMAIMYGTTAWHKMLGHTWRDGTATWYPPRLSEFERFPVPPFLDHPPFLQMGTWGVLVVQVALATLVFHAKWRKPVLIGGLLMHGYIEWRFNIPLFAFLSVSLYVSHYRGEEIAEWWDRVRRGRARSGARAGSPG